MKYLKRFEKFSSQDRLDDILDKISKSGEKSLTDAEKNFLKSWETGDQDKIHRSMKDEETKPKEKEKESHWHEIEPGDLVDFPEYGELWVVMLMADGYLVSDDEDDIEKEDGFIIPYSKVGDFKIIEKGTEDEENSNLFDDGDDEDEELEDVEREIDWSSFPEVFKSSDGKFKFEFQDFKNYGSLKYFFGNLEIPYKDSNLKLKGHIIKLETGTIMPMFRSEDGKDIIMLVREFSKEFDEFLEDTINEIEQELGL